MPTRRHQARRTLTRFADANARRTADVVELVEVAPYGSHRIVRRPDCEDTFLVKSATPDVSLKPGTTVLASLNPAGGGLVHEAAPTGRGGVLPVIGESSSFEVDSATLVLRLFAFYYDDSTHITVKRLDDDLGIVETTIDNKAFPDSGSWDGSGVSLRAGISMISGDTDRVQNGSFTLFSNTVLYLVSPGGSFNEIFDPANALGVGVALMFRAVHWDVATGYVYLGTYRLSDDQEWRLYRVRTDGADLELVNSGSVSGSDTFDPGAVIWGDDRAIFVYQDGSNEWEGCIEVPFDGTAETVRDGDTPIPTDTIAEGPEFAPAGGRYLASDIVTSWELKGQRLPLTTGDAATLSWPTATFFAGYFKALYGTFHDGYLYFWPVLKADNPLTATEIYLLKYDPSDGGVPGIQDLALMPSATGNPVAPFAVLPVSV